MKNQQTNIKLDAETNQLITAGFLCFALGIVTIIVWAIFYALFPINMASNVVITVTSAGFIIHGSILVLIGFVRFVTMMGIDPHDTP